MLSFGVWRCPLIMSEHLHYSGGACQLVDAGGIEPPSNNDSQMESTRVVFYLILVLKAPKDRIPFGYARICFASVTPGTHLGYPTIVANLMPAGVAMSGGRVIYAALR